MRGAAAKCTCIVLSLLVSSLFVRTGNATGTEVFGEEGGYVDLPCAPAYDPTNNLHWQVIQRGTGSNIIFLVKEPGKDVEIRYTRLAGRLSLRDSNNLRISNLNRDDDSVDSTDPHFVGTYRCSQPQEEDPLEGDQFILRVRREEVTLQSTLPASNTTYHICVVAQNRLNSTRCDDAYIQATTDKKNDECAQKPSTSHVNSEASDKPEVCRVVRNYVLITTDSVASFNATIRLPNDAFISPDPNHRENQGLVDRIIDSQEIKSVKADLVSKVRSGDLTGIDVDINYLRIDDESPQGPDIVAIVLSSIAAAGVALIAGVAAYLFCRGSAKNTYIEGVKDTIEMALGLDLNKLKELTKGDANLSILLPPPAATEKPISNVRLPDTGFHDSTDCKNIVAKAGEGNSLVIIGSTGSGKTQGVLAYAKGFAEKNANAIMWFFGRSENEEKGLTKETIKEQGIELAKKFGHGNLSPEELPNKIMKSLQNRQSKSLLVFDDVTATSGIPAAYLSASEKVTVFITTCSANLDLTLPEYKMEGFTKDDVLKFLKREDKKSVEIFGKTPDEDLLKLADHFGNLPHGLSLARSYMLSSRTSVKGYLRELEERSNRVGGELKAHEKAVYGAILLAMENRMSGTSQEMLKFAAILSQDRIPIFILSKGVEISFDENPDKDEFITEVDELSLARVEGKKEEWIDGRMISVHQQTQAAILANLDEEELETMRRSLIQVFLEYFHKDTRKIQDGYINGLLLPHVEAVLNLRTISELPENYHTGLARLYETIGYMYCQKRLPEAAIFPLEKAKEMISKIVPLDTDADTIFQSLVEKGSELYGQEDVYSKNLKKRVLTTGDVGVLKTKALTLSDDFMAAAKMGKPLTEEQFQQLVQLHLAYNAEQIQQSFLVELAATVLYTSARRIFYFQGEERVQYRQTAEKDLNLSLTLSQKLASDQGLEILNKMLSQRSGTLYLLKETEGKSTEQQKEDFLLAIEGYQNLINDDKDYFENGVLKKIGDDDWHRMHCYRAIVYTYNDLITKLATTDQERADYIRLHDESAQKMVDFGEKQVKKDDKGKVIEAPEMLPEIYNMSGDFLIQMIEKGFVKPEDGNPLGRAKQWYHEALDVESIKAYHEAVSRLGLAKAFTLMYEAETAKVTTNGETRIPMHDADEKIPLVNNNPTLDEIHHLINAKEEMNKSLKIYEEELRNRTKDIQEAKKWNDRIVRHIDSLPNVPKEQESTV
uniref:NB-ARC domain-containing protein n=1 Tax=Branchiostoma floridae TaxID=7739 RepID=C3ZSQ9_BRAFL|eukprot:XP_002588450.1 hypothetical protein BRAFLDRAFT_63399 [Branchiostoma floridae]